MILGSLGHPGFSQTRGPVWSADNGPSGLATVQAPPLRSAAAPEPSGQRQTPAEPGQPGRLETLEDAWAIATTTDRRLASSQWDVSSAANHLEAARAERWPVVGLEASYTLRSDEPSFRIRSPLIPSLDDSFPYMQRDSAAFGTHVALPLYTGGRIQSEIAAASSRLTATTLGTRIYQNEMHLRVAEEYVAVLRAQQVLRVAETSVANLEAHARDARALLANGRACQNDVLAADVAVLNARQRVIDATNRLEAARATYNRRLARPLESPVRIAEVAIDCSPVDLQALVAQALENRPERSQLVAEIAALRHQADSVSARNGVQVQLQGDYAYQENRYQTPDGIAAAGVVVGWNAFDGGRHRHEASALMDRASALEELLADLDSRIALDVRCAFLDLEGTCQQLNVTQEAVRQAEENLRIVNEHYATGMIVATEVLQAESMRIQAHCNHHHAIYDAILARMRLRHAAGILAQSQSAPSASR